MRRFPETLAGIILDSGLKLNAISKASGISHTYLTKLVTGRINRPGKDKIASILLALNHTFGEINDVLAEYDYRPLDLPDIPEILRNNRKRRIEGTTLPLFSHIYMELVLSPMERGGGTKVLVKDRPSALFMPEDLYLQDEYPFDLEQDDRALHVMHQLTLALLQERKAIFEESVHRGNRFETFICARCLEAYLDQALAPPRDAAGEAQRGRITAYFGNAVAALRRCPEQHRTFLVHRCGHLHYQLQDAGGAHPRVFYIGKKPHAFDNPHDSLTIQGFASDAPSTIKVFQRETDLYRRAAIASLARDYPNRLIDHLCALFQKAGLERALLDSAEHAAAGERKMV